MTLTCSGCGADFPRDRPQGRPPKLCFDCRPGVPRTCGVCGEDYKGKRTNICGRCQAAARYVPSGGIPSVCVRCGEGFLRTSRQRYCASACAKEAKRLADNERARIRWGERPLPLKRQTCAECGVEFVATKRMCCSDACQAARNADKERARAERKAERPISGSCPVPWADCSWCSRPFVQRRGKKYCSDPCRRALAALHESGGQTDIAYRECEHCRSTFVARSCRTKVYCSNRCARSSTKRVRRHLKRVSSGADRITIGTLGERDGWVCHLCGEAVRRPPWSAEIDDATIDHLVPVSKGGSHTWGNVALAHFMCNTLRNDADLEVVAA